MPSKHEFLSKLLVEEIIFLFHMIRCDFKLIVLLVRTGNHDSYSQVSRYTSHVFFFFSQIYAKCDTFESYLRIKYLFSLCVTSDAFLRQYSFRRTVLNCKRSLLKTFPNGNPNMDSFFSLISSTMWRKKGNEILWDLCVRLKKINVLHCSVFWRYSTKYDETPICWVFHRSNCALTFHGYLFESCNRTLYNCWAIKEISQAWYLFHGMKFSF